MKRYAVADEVPEDCDYLTAGKEYEVVSASPRECPMIVNDRGRVTFICPSESCHIGGKSWRILEREE